MGIYYKVYDNEFFFVNIEFGLGKIKYDVLIRKNFYYLLMNGEDNLFIVIEEFGLKEGILVWIWIWVDNGGRYNLL